MKRLILLMFVCIGFIGASQSSFAQSTALAPYDGATHTYKFKGIAQDREFQFYLSPAANNIDASSGESDFGTFVTSATGTVDASGEAVVQIKWAANASSLYGASGTKGTQIYLYVKVYESTGGSGICENYKAVKIVPVSNSFSIALADQGTSPSCPDLTDGFNPLVAPTDEYNAGKTTLSFEVTRSGSANDWSLGFDITHVGTGAFTYSIDGGTATNGTVGGTTNVNVATISANNTIIQIVVDNVPGETPKFTITPTGAQDLVTLISPLTLPSAVVHDINEMPVIGDFEGI